MDKEQETVVDPKLLTNPKVALSVAGLLLILSGVQFQGLGVSFAAVGDTAIFASMRQILGIGLMVFGVVYRPRDRGRRTTDNFSEITKQQEDILRFILEKGSVSFDDVSVAFPQYQPKDYLKYRMRHSCAVGACQWDAENLSYAVTESYRRYLSSDETSMRP